MLEDSGGGAPDGRTAAGPRRPRAVSTDDKTAATALLAMAWAVLLVTGVAEAVLSTATFKGEQQSDIGVQIGQSAMLPCELDDRGRHQCGSVHSVKWYRGASRIFLYSSAVPVTQPRKGYQDRTSWSYTPNDTVAYLVLENITAQDESIYKCEITYTAVHEGCNIVQFINLTTHIDPDYIGVGVLPADDGNNNNEVGGASDAGDSEYDETQKRTVKMNSGSVVGPLDEDGNVRLYCESGRAKPVPQVTWWWNGSQLSSGTDYRFKRLPGGLSVARNVLTLSPLKRGSGGRYECRVKTAANASPVLTSFLELTVNVRPLSVQIISNAGDDDDDDDDDSHTVAATVSGTSDPSDSEPAAASAVEGRGLVLKCVARGARPQANVTWYYYQKDDAGESGGGGDNDEDDAKKNAVDRDDSSSKSNHQHKQPVVLSSGRPGELTTTGSTTTPPAPAIGSVEIAQHTEYQADGTRDTHSQLEMSSLNRRQDGSILRCDAYNSVGQNKEGSTTRPLSVNMTIRVKYAPTVWLARPKIIVINESQSVNVQCEYSANPMNPALVKWYRNGVEIAVEDYGGGNRKAAGSSANNILLSSTSTKYFRVNETGLRIDRAHRSASGEYSCSVRNAVGQTNSTDVVKLLVQYTPRVRLELVIDGEGNDDEKSSVPSHRPAVLESEQLNVTLRCAVVSEDGGAEADSDGMKSDGTYDPSLNLTVVHWYWNGVQMQLPNCSRPDGYDDDFEDEDENNGATNNYFYSPGIVGPGDFDEETMLIMRNQHADENGTSKRRTMRVVCSDRELVLMNVSKNMHGNYSCRARNAAGLLTPMSEQTPLVVYFAPGPVTLEFSPRRVIKGRNVTLRCNAQYLGRPQHPTNYSWYRDGHQVIMNNHNHNQNNSAEWFVEHVSLETRANFTCSAFNAGGVTKSEPVYIEVLAPPNYISRAPQYKGVAYNDTHVNASCTVECYPLCSVEWLRQNVPIDPINNPQDKQRYSIVTEYLPAERLKNDFEAVRSTLVWRLENWTNGMGRPGLDPATDSTTYSCRSSSNNVGVGVPESTMHFSVEYPPTNMSVSKTVVHVNEGNIPEKVFCNADAHPGPTFEWYRQNSESSSSSSSAAALATNSSQQPSGQLQTATQQQPFSQMERKSTANWLMFNTAVFPKHAGNYICVAHNAHGDGVIQTYLDVMYKPSCTLNLMKVSDPEATPIVNSLLKDNPSRPDDGGAAAYDLDDPERRILVCTVKANPGQVQFTWTTVRRENQNDTDSPAAVSYPVTEETVVTWGESVVPTDVEGFTAYSPNRSVLILKESVAMSEENGIDGVRTYVCTISNAVGTEQCTVKVQGDTPWWKQLLVAVGLGGLGIQSGWIVVVVLVILAVIIIAVLSLLIFLLCRKFMQPDGTQKYWRGNRHNLGTGRSGQPLDGGSNGGIDSKAFYENLPFHGMRPPPNQLPARNIDQFSYQLQQLQLQYQHDRQQPPQLCRNDRANETTNQYATPVAPTAQQYNSTTISRTALQPNHHHQSMEMTQMADRRSEQLREPQRWPAYGQRRPQQREDDGGATLDSYYHRGSVQQPNAGGGGSMDGSLQKDPSTGNSTKRRRQGHAGGMYGRTNTIGGGDTAAPDTESQRRRRNVWADSAGAEHTSFTNSHYYGRRRTNAINDNGGNYNTLGGRTVSVNGYDTGGRQKRSQPKRTLSSSYYCPGGSSTWKAGTAGGDRQDDDDDGRPGTRPDAPEVAVVGCGGVTSADGTANREDTPAGTVKFHRDVGREIDV
ncbi:uncharacterized protein LOC126898699 isoform X4 [Daktulosphaira vitifoliae]|uniref:uncharacterized protein LOC126898699 isoform X4 n=1 Tax=Daktulosphaira vitifoliae TaxID=58002 RepID=UPI0021A99D9E|nr:uncharacterized protein LOC126898699 isoform X4 [Daktulosphaira vitifoliae]